MPEFSVTQQKLKDLLDSAESIKVLPAGAREDLENKLMALDDEQIEAVIKILEEEKDKVAALKAELKRYDDRIADLFGKARQASRDLKLAFMKAVEAEQGSVESAQTEDLLKKL